MSEFLGSSSPLVSSSSHKIVYNNKVLEFHVIRSYRRKKTSEISVVNGLVSLKVPMTTPIQEIESLITRKANWIQQRICEQNNPYITIKVPTYSTNSTLPYLGKNYPLKIIEYDLSLLEFSNDQFIIYTKKNNIKRLYEEWLYRMSLSIFNPLIERYSQILNVTPKKVLLKKLKSRWGSATHSNIINLNIHLLKAPIDVIEYVILHELSHLIERNHSHRFWKLVSDNMGDYKTKKRWLQINGPYMM